MIRSAAAGVGNVLVLFGALTGRDGIGGASVLASAELGEDEDKRPSVQIGDPFEEKKLLESLASSCSTRACSPRSRTSARPGSPRARRRWRRRARSGSTSTCDKVPLREADMEPFEVMISESQERMLCVVEPEQARRGARRVREVGGPRHARSARSPTPAGCACSPAARWWATCPSRRSWTTARCTTSSRPSRSEPVYRAPAAKLDGDESPGDTLLALLARPTSPSKRWAFEQYDWIVGSRTTRRPEEADAAVLMLEPDGGSGAIAVSIDGNGRRVACDPYTGAVEAVLECARNLACVGAEPLGLTNCLNFGNPEKPHIAWQLTRAVEGLRDACLARRRAGGGRQRLALQRGRRAGRSTPRRSSGMVGKLPDPSAVPWSGFREAGHAIALVGPFAPAPAGSELEKLQGRLLRGAAADRPRRRTRPRSTACATRCARARSRRRTTSPRAGSPARWPSARSSAGSARRVGRSAATSPLFGEGPGGVLLAGPREAHRGARRIPATARFSSASARRAATGSTSPPALLRSRVPVAAAQEAYERVDCPSRFE